MAPVRVDPDKVHEFRDAASFYRWLGEHHDTADEVWMVVAGDDKAGAVGLALAGAGTVQVPAAGPRGRNRTLWLIDEAAAAKVPENLVHKEPRGL